MNGRIVFMFLAAALLLAACGKSTPSTPTMDPRAMVAAFATVNAAFTQTAQAVPTGSPTATVTPVPILSVPMPFTPTAILNVTVLVPVLFCRFGPDTVYASPYGLRYGKVREAIGRSEDGIWLLVREPGGQKGCWVSAPNNVRVQGDPSTLSVAPVKLQLTSAYPPPPNMKAVRTGDQIQITWSAVTVQKQDIYPNNRYLVDAWVCNSGQLVHKLIGTNDHIATLTDEPGCTDPSHGQIATATKVGYSLPEQILPWP